MLNTFQLIQSTILCKENNKSEIICRQERDQSNKFRTETRTRVLQGKKHNLIIKIYKVKDIIYMINTQFCTLNNMLIIFSGLSFRRSYFYV